jgi:rRNA-processing protein EBP2
MSTPLQWIETLDLYGPTNADGLKPDQASELEKRMYEAALASAKEGYRRLSILKVPASRRTDYFAEMLKDDKQMTKIRTQLVTVQQRIEAVETRKKKQAQRKFAKQLKAAKIEKKKEEKAESKMKKPTLKSADKKEFRSGGQKGFRGSTGAKKSISKGGKPFSSKGKGSGGKGKSLSNKKSKFGSKRK